MYINVIGLPVPGARVVQVLPEEPGPSILAVVVPDGTPLALAEAIEEGLRSYLPATVAWTVLQERALAKRALIPCKNASDVPAAVQALTGIDGERFRQLAQGPDRYNFAVQIVGEWVCEARMRWALAVCCPVEDWTIEPVRP